MGFLEGEEVWDEEKKTFVKLKCDTVSCKHCQAIIKIVIRGPCAKEIDTKYRCDRCCGPICKACAKQMHDRGGICNPLNAKIAASILADRWVGDVPWNGEGLG